MYNTWMLPDDCKKQIISVMNTSYPGEGGINTATLIINTDNPLIEQEQYIQDLKAN